VEGWAWGFGVLICAVATVHFNVSGTLTRLRAESPQNEGSVSNKGKSVFSVAS
jgi:hypothetical protein